MAKKKKKNEIKISKTPRPRETNDIICDTSASAEPILDLNVQGQTIEGLLNLERTYPSKDNITVSWRIPQELLKKAKNIAMKESLSTGEEIHYQKLVMGCFLEKYNLGKE